MAGFGYGANLSAVVCWDSRHFDDAPGKVVQDCFSQRWAMSSWATDGCSRRWGWFTRNAIWSRLVVRSCSHVRVFEQRHFALAHWMPLLCVPWLQGALTETRWCCCASMGFVLEGICDSFANACYTRSSLERNSPQTSLPRSRHWIKRWTTVL